jgi:hypothetical protein
MSKSTSKSSAKVKLLSKAERSAIQRLAGMRAHAHPTFQKSRKPAERKAIVASFNSALKSAPKWLRERFDRL